MANFCPGCAAFHEPNEFWNALAVTPLMIHAEGPPASPPAAEAVPACRGPDVPHAATPVISTASAIASSGLGEPTAVFMSFTFLAPSCAPHGDAAPWRDTAQRRSCCG
jgi:hypothetical protein